MESFNQHLNSTFHAHFGSVDRTFLQKINLKPKSTRVMMNPLSINKNAHNISLNNASLLKRR